jgi:hypothetical protein
MCLFMYIQIALISSGRYAHMFIYLHICRCTFIGLKFICLKKCIEIMYAYNIRICINDGTLP